MAKTEPKRRKTTAEKIAELQTKEQVELCGASIAEVKGALKNGNFEHARDYAHDLLTRLEKLCGEKSNGQPVSEGE